MNINKYGLLLRVYAKEEKDVDSIVKRAIKNIQFAIDVDCFSEIVILIPADYDCGTTMSKLELELPKLNKNNLAVCLVYAFGHHSCDALNKALLWGFSCEISKVAIVSGKVMQYVTQQTMWAVGQAFDDRALVVGVATAELEECVLSGRVQNTFAVWDLAQLMLSGFKTKLGVEEIDPLVHLIQCREKCIAILDPKEKPALNIRKSADGVARHKEVMETKLKNQQIEVARLGVDFDFIKNGIMDGYPKKV